jgi:NAD(P)-dependent dehydrogenase (short-subunit alcohol dehydrogenase family)
VWQAVWEVNVLAHVLAARVVLPSMLERGHGYLLNTASAAGLLTQIGNAPYAVTKHAAVGLAEWLAITYGDLGIRVSVLCPQGVRTNMLRQAAQGDPAMEPLLVVGSIEPEQVAADTVEGLRDERFWILPHPEVADYVRRKADDVDRWLAGMRRLQARIGAAPAHEG